MHPHDISLFGTSVSIWNAYFAVAVAAGYLVFLRTIRTLPAAPREQLSFASVRFWLVVYLSALAAQVFAYAFDTNTSLSPPPGVSLAAYYLDPLAGPKTLYGVIVLMPLAITLATLGSHIRLARALDLWTPAMLVVLAVARIGCFVQGCCYGMRSEAFGIRFPAGSPVFFQHVGDGLVGEAAAASLPVVPTQLLEAVVLAATAGWVWRRRERTPTGGTFVYAVVVYSVFRFAAEFVRADATRGIYGPLATSQWIALAVLAVALAGSRRVRVARVPAVAAQECETHRVVLAAGDRP